MQRSFFIKICGITRLEDARYAIESGVDAIGFIAYDKSPRYISVEKVRSICKNINSANVKKVAVFVNSDMNNIHEYLDAGIDIVQLHGNENAKFADKLKSECEVWKAIKPASKNDILKFREFPADKFLIDAFHEKLYGGTGKTVDQEFAKFAVSELPAPVILAGGISVANFEEILREVHPFGLDINSGVEKSPGIKDHNLIKELFTAILQKK